MELYKGSGMHMDYIERNDKKTNLHKPGEHKQLKKKTPHTYIKNSRTLYFVRDWSLKEIQPHATSKK
jgi:hypothetical protein